MSDMSIKDDTVPIIEPFDMYSNEYDEWFEKNKFVYESELLVIKNVIPKDKVGLEIGVGSARFSAPLGIKIGIEPSSRLREIAEKRGVECIDAVAEDLPFKNSTFDFALMVTTICFVDDLLVAFKEAHRVIKNDGSLIIGFVNKESTIGKEYQERKDKSLFYKKATFYSVDEVVSCLKEAGFRSFEFLQTIFHNLKDIKAIEPVREGYKEGSFVVICAKKLRIN